MYQLIKILLVEHTGKFVLGFLGISGQTFWYISFKAMKCLYNGIPMSYICKVCYAKCLHIINQQNTKGKIHFIIVKKCI